MTENNFKIDLECLSNFKMDLECLREVSGGKSDAMQQSSKDNFHGKPIMYTGTWELMTFCGQMMSEFPTFGLRVVRKNSKSQKSVLTQLVSISHRVCLKI